MHRIISYVSVLLVVVLSGCVQQQNTPFTVSAASLQAGDAVPPPEAEPVVTFSGNISVTNMEATLSLDLPTLEHLTVVEYQVSDPWERKQITYRGVLLAELLALAGASETAQSIVVTAWDDYTAEIPLSEIEAWPIMLATHADGEMLTLETNGPTRIIFPYDSYNNLTSARNMSVWNVAVIEVK